MLHMWQANNVKHYVQLHQPEIKPQFIAQWQLAKHQLATRASLSKIKTSTKTFLTAHLHSIHKFIEKISMC